MKYGQFCPVAKASEILGERWMLLLLRELVAGSTRYGDLQRGLGRISPSVLSSRLKTLTERGIVERVESHSVHGSEYRLTRAGAELAPIIGSIATWGQRWTRTQLSPDELDIELLMLGVQRSFDVAAFSKNHAVVAFVFSDVPGALRRWWLLVDNGHTELCSQYPGRSEDVTLTCGLRTLTEVYLGELTLADALGARRVQTQGPAQLVRDLHRCLRASPQATPPRPPGDV